MISEKDPDARPEPPEPRVMVRVSEYELLKAIRTFAEAMLPLSREMPDDYKHGECGYDFWAEKLESALDKLKEVAGK